MITQPYVNFIQPDAGGNVKPVSNGRIYIGNEGLDPKAGGNPIYYRDNQGVEKEISNPLYLNMTGVVVAGLNDSDIINPYTKKPISILIEDKNGHEVYSELVFVSSLLSTEDFKYYTDIVYKASHGKTAVDNMIEGNPISIDVGEICQCENGTIFKRVGNSSGNIDDYICINGANVLDFGADIVGNLDSTNEIQLALDLGGLTLFPSGKYLFTEVSCSGNATIEGIGNPVLLGKINVELDIHAHGFSMEGGSISSAPGADLGNVLIENVKFDGSAQAVNLQGDGDVGSIQSLIVRGCEFSNQTQRAINIRCANLGHCHVDSNYIHNLNSTTFAEAIRIGTNKSLPSSRGMMVTNNTIRDIYTSSANESHAIIIQGGRGIVTGNEIENVSNGAPSGSESSAEAIYTKCFDSIISDNTIVNGVKGVEGAITIKGVDSSGDPQFGSGCIISNNQIRNTDESVGRCINIMVSHCSIRGNRVFGASSDGIGVFTLYDSVGLDGGERVIISDNYVSTSGLTGINCRRVQSNVTINNNIVVNSGSQGIQVETPSDASAGSRVVCSNWIVSDNNIDQSNGSALYLFARDNTDLKDVVMSGNNCSNMDRIMTFAGNPARASINNITIRDNMFSNYTSKITTNGYDVWGGVICNITNNDGLPTRVKGFHDYTVGQSGRKDVYFESVGDGTNNYHVQATMSCSGDTFTRQYLTTSNRGPNFIVLNVNTTDDSSNTIQNECRVFFDIRHIADKG